MTDVSITPEDREKLARSKFSEWLFEGLNSDAGKTWFAERVKEIQAQAGQQQQQGQQQQGQQQGQQQQPPQRRRSLLDMCLTDTFGF